MIQSFSAVAFILLAAVSAIAADAISVRDYGAIGDNVTDDTVAFQKALDACSQSFGGVVSVPTGNYLIKGHLNVPSFVTLEGVFKAPTARSKHRGTTLSVVEGKGNAGGEPFITLNADSALKGVTIFYPEQDATSPVPYPWCVRGIGDNCTVLDVLMINPWNAVDFGTYPCGRHLIRGLYGQPLSTGIFVDQCFDVGRIEDVHFWPFWSEALIPFTQKEAVAFRFARTDWEMLSGCFCLGYKIGFHFTAIRHDAGNAMIVNSGADLCAVGVRVEYSQVHAGILFTNCQINAGAQVGPGSLGPIKFMNCGMFGLGSFGLPYLSEGEAKARYVMNRGQGRMTFLGCHFYHPEGPFLPKDFVEVDYPAIDTESGGLTISGCDFTGIKGTHLRLGTKSRSTLVTASRFLGEIQVENQGSGKVVMEGNLDE